MFEIAWFKRHNLRVLKLCLAVQFVTAFAFEKAGFFKCECRTTLFHFGLISVELFYGLRMK
jgi:hypothetical protein